MKAGDKHEPRVTLGNFPGFVQRRVSLARIGVERSDTVRGTRSHSVASHVSYRRSCHSPKHPDSTSEKTRQHFYQSSISANDIECQQESHRAAVIGSRLVF